MNYDIGSKYQLGQSVIVDGEEGVVSGIALDKNDDVEYTVISDVGEFYPLSEDEIQPNSTEGSTDSGIWQPAHTAPKDALILADFGWPWPVMATWCEQSAAWAVVSTQRNSDGHGSTVAAWFETGYGSEHDLRRWLPWPILPAMKSTEANNEPESALSAQAGSVSIAAARMHRLNQGLTALARWAQNRSMKDHDESTTMTMLRRKLCELEDAVNCAGWRVSNQATPPNK